MTHQRPKTDGVAPLVVGHGAGIPLPNGPALNMEGLGSASTHPAYQAIGITDLTDAATKSMTDPSMEELARQIQTHLNAEQIYLGNAQSERLQANKLKARLDEKFEAESKRVTGHE